MQSERKIVRTVSAIPTSDGAGVNLKRSIGTAMLDYLGPFLLLDNIESDEAADYIGGFPEHPHRGFETVTYMVEGRMRHRDSMGSEGLLESGGAQWMTAGRGVVHSEMPEQEEGRLHGFQLWVNLPAARKMIPARYQDIQPDAIPEIELEHGKVRLLAGEYGGASGPINGIDIEPVFLDVEVKGGSVPTISVPEDHTAFVYVFAGEVAIADQTITANTLAVLSEGKIINPSGNGRALIVAGAPIGETIARHGPFVMNTEQELRQAFHDFQTGNFLKDRQSH